CSAPHSASKGLGPYRHGRDRYQVQDGLGGALPRAWALRGRAAVRNCALPEFPSIVEARHVYHPEVFDGQRVANDVAASNSPYEVLSQHWKEAGRWFSASGVVGTVVCLASLVFPTLGLVLLAATNRGPADEA